MPLTRASIWGLTIATLAAALIFGASSLPGTKSGRPQDTRDAPLRDVRGDAALREVSFTADDGYRLSATLSLPQRPGPYPAIILSHQFNGTRHDYDSLVPVLLKNGYAAFAYDTRGFGESRNGATDINDFPKDVIGAIDFLKKQPDIDSSRIGVVGASVGANVAFVASGTLKEIRAAVSISPSNTGVRGVLLGNDRAGFSPRRIFIASDEREKGDADVILSKSAEPKEQHVYQGFGHGIGILKSEEARRDIISFLERTLSTTTPLSPTTIRVPVVLHLIKESGAASTARDRDNVLALFEKSQEIWRQAGIVFRERLEETALPRKARSALQEGDVESLAAFIPEDGALHIFFVRTLRGSNGITIAPSLALIADQTTVNDFRATAHEIGHLLGLPHTAENPARLLYQGANGTELTEEEISLARRAATRF